MIISYYHDTYSALQSKVKCGHHQLQEDGWVHGGGGEAQAWD